MPASEASNEDLPPLYVLSSTAPAPATSIPSSESSPPASVHSVHSTRSTHSEQAPHHPILDSQTEYYNRAFPPPSTTEASSEMSYSTPNSSDYSYSPAGTPQRTVTVMEINSMIQSLRSRRVNTLTELRRIERTLAVLPAFTTDYIVNLQDAWNHYVNCNNFLNELRGLTRRYPFSTELLEEAKQRVINDANSNRSWNFAWLLLVKMRNDGLITEYATRTAHQPAMWGGYVPDQSSALELANVLDNEWTKAVDVLLRHWPIPPTLTGAY